MYRVRRIGWQTLVVMDEDRNPINPQQLQQWQQIPGVAFATPGYRPHIVSIGFSIDVDMREKSTALMKKIIETLPGDVAYCDINGNKMSEQVWYQ